MTTIKKVWPLRRILRYTVLGTAASVTAVSLHANNYQFDSIGIVRLTRAAVKVYDIASIYHKKLYVRRDLDPESEEYENLKSECHKLGAEKLLELCQTNKGVYIKVGQHIGALDYLVPKEYVQTMQVLHSRAPTNTIEEVYKVLKEEFKQDPHKIFKEFDPQPLGVASLAQVHRALLHTGETVAVKVQHSYVRGNSLIDLKTMEILVAIVSRVFPEFSFQWLVDETKKNIPRELDFVHEGHNAEKIKKICERFKWLKVPDIYWRYTTPRVLTMEFVEGGQINDLDYIKKNQINTIDVSNKLGYLYSTMIFIEGFVHSDPHPGNILVRKNESKNVEIVLLDHGLYANLTEEFRYEYAQLWLGILNRDRHKMRLHSNNLGINNELYGLFSCMVTGRTWDTVMAGIQNTKQTKTERNVLKREFPNFLPKISTVLQNVNSQMLLILKTNDLIRGIEHTLETQSRMISFLIMSKACIRNVYDIEFSKTIDTFSKIRVNCKKHWLLFKLSLYYLWRGVVTFSFFDTVKQMFIYS